MNKQEQVQQMTTYMSNVVSHIAKVLPDDIIAKLDELGAVRIPAGQIAREVGSPRSTNVVLVGALSTALPFSVEDWEDAISRRVPPKTVEANLKAFRQGRVAAEA